MWPIPRRTERHVPRGAGVIDRPRLLSKLQGALEHKLTLISAPPGYGKTTLVAQFARQSPYPVAWHTIEERERDIPNLYNQSLAVLEQVAPGIKELAPPYGYATTELAALIADYLREKLPGDVIYILDDVHRLAGAPAAEAWLRALVALVPASCHLILLSRILPDLPLIEMIARREVLAIGQEELRFTSQEIYDLGNELLGAPPSPERTLEVAVRLEGWPAGTVLAFLPLPPDLERAILSGGEGPEALFDALAASMLEAQPSDIRDFLLASSTLSRITPVLCASVLELPNSVERLAEAQIRNLFLSRASGGLVYHTLFRNFLQRRLKVTDPNLFASLHIKAARWFMENDQVDEAFDHYLAAGLDEQAAAIAERISRAYFAQGKVETLLNWGAKLGRVRAQVPRVLHRCAIIHTDRYEYAEAETELDEAEAAFAARQDEDGLADVHLQRAMIRLQRGEYREAAAQAMQLAELPPGPTNIQGRALGILGAAHLRLGEVETAIRRLEEALPLYRANGDAYALSQILQNLGVAYSRSGHLDAANACLQEVVALQRSLGSAGALALALNNLGYYYHRGGDYKQALLCFQEGLSVIARFPNRRAETYLLWSLGDLQGDRGAFDEALEFYQKALELLGSSEPSLRCSLLISFSMIRRWQGRLPEAIALATEASTLAGNLGLAGEGCMAQAAIWSARALSGQAAEALRHLDAAASDLRRHGLQFELMQAFGLCAHAALLCSDRPAAEAYWRSAVNLTQEIGSVHPLVSEIMRSPLLESLAAADSPMSEALHSGLERLREAQLKAPHETRASGKTAMPMTYSLRVLTLGQENMLRDGKPVPSSEWRAIAARELFLYLLFVGPQSREQISLEFWPDSSTKRVRSNFHTTLYRARQALGENVITFKDDVYLIDPQIDVWCDAQETEALAVQARLLSPRDVRTEDLWRRAVALYRGDFLPSLDAEWIATRRETLREIYLEALIGLGECARARGDFREALGVFRRALGLEPYREDIHRAIMTCYAERGEKQKVLIHLRELQRLFRQELAAEPSMETLAHVEALLN